MKTGRPKLYAPNATLVASLEDCVPLLELTPSQFRTFCRVEAAGRNGITLAALHVPIGHVHFLVNCRFAKIIAAPPIIDPRKAEDFTGDFPPADPSNEPSNLDVWLELQQAELKKLIVPFR